MRLGGFLLSCAILVYTGAARGADSCPFSAEDVFTKSFADSFVTLEEMVDEKLAEERDGKSVDETLYLPPVLRFRADAPGKIEVEVTKVLFAGKPHEVIVHLTDAPGTAREAIAKKVRDYATAHGSKALAAFPVSRLLTPEVHSVKVETLEGDVKFDGVELRPDGHDGFGAYLRAEVAGKDEADALVAKLLGEPELKLRVSFQIQTSHGDKTVVQTIAKDTVWPAACREDRKEMAREDRKEIARDDRKEKPRSVVQKVGGRFPQTSRSGETARKAGSRGAIARRGKLEARR